MSKQNRISRQELRKAQQEAAAKAARRRRILTIAGSVVILALVAAIVVVVIKAAGGSNDNNGPSTSGPVVTPANLNSDGGIPVGDDPAPVTVTLYYDYMCPICGEFEKINGADLDSLIESGTAKMDLRPMNFLDPKSNGTKYSTRAASAVAATVNAAPNDVWAFHKALYAHQPEEGSDGLSDDEIASIATDAGVPADVVATFAKGTYAPWVAQSNQKAFDAGVQGTPTVLIDGKAFADWSTPGALKTAVENAAK